MRSVCATSVCNSAPLRLLRVALYIGLAAIGHFFLGGGAAAALHPVAHRHPARDCQRALSLHRRRYSDYDGHAGDSMGARAAIALARLRLAHYLHRDPPRRRLYGFQRVAQRRNPPYLVLHPGDAGPSLNRHRPHTVAAVGGRARPRFCQHCGLGPTPSSAEAVRAAFTFTWPCAMRES